MKIIKRNGMEAVFTIDKIIAAVSKANQTVSPNRQLSDAQIQEIANAVEQNCSALGHAVDVEEIQDMVENQIMAHSAFEVARHYITYRYIQSLKRTANTTDERIL